jgi:hypothetical protein
MEMHHDERAPREMPRPTEARDIDEAETPRVLVDRPAIHDPFDKDSPDRYGDPLTRPDGTRISCFNGPPTREQTSQGRIHDCGVIAVLGAVAAHRPYDVEGRISEQPNGAYQVRLSEARRTDTGAVPTGRSIEVTVTPELPVRNAAPDIPAAAEAADGAAWCPVLEKALAGVDQTWTADRRSAWDHDWGYISPQARGGSARNLDPDQAPDGYVRLNQGSEAWDRAEILTQLTGQEAVVREFPSGRDEWLINKIIRAQLADSKPVLVSTRELRDDERKLPHNLVPAHVYEVTDVDMGKIILRNPWNKDHPQPLETDDFARNVRPWYTTLP